MPRTLILVFVVLLLGLGGLTVWRTQPADQLPEGLTLHTPVKNKRTVSHPHRLTGAFEALTLWSQARTYPYESFPQEAFMLAVQEQQAQVLPQRVTAALSTWEAIGPHNLAGRTLALAFDPVDPNIVWAGSASGGLWKTTTGGVGSSAWTLVPTGYPILSISSVLIDPADPDRMFLGTGEVYNYEAAGTGHATRTTRGVYGIGILRSLDGGATWDKSLDWSLNQEHGVWKVALDPQNSSTLWAATTEGVYKSTDGGNNWSLSHSVIMATDLEIDPGNPDIVVVACGNLGSTGHGIYRTTNGGTSWTKSTSGLPVVFGGKIQLDMHPGTSNILYASIGNSSTASSAYTWLAKSVDSGATWSVVSTLDFTKYQGWYSHDVSMHPDDPNDLLCVGVDTYKSTNGGSTLNQVSDWQNYYIGPRLPGDPEGLPDFVHADIHAIVRHPDNPDTVYFATDGGVFRTLDNGTTFQSLNGGYQTAQFYAGFSTSKTNANRSIGGLQDNASAMYSGSTAWSVNLIGGDGSWSAFDPVDTTIVYGSYYYLGIAKSFDGGANWNFGFEPPDFNSVTAFIAPFVMAPTNPSRLYAGRNKILLSNTGGLSWSYGNGAAPLDGNNPAICMAISSLTSQRFYVATAPFSGSMGVFRSDNGGVSFTSIKTGLPDRYPGDLYVDPNNDDRVVISFLGFGSSHVFLTEDAGATWQDIGTGLPDMPTGAVAIDPLHPGHIYVGNDIGVWATTNEGASWLPLNDGFGDAIMVFDLNIVEPSRELRAVTHGRGVFDLDLLGTQIAARDLPAPGLALRQNIPNPFTTQTTIAFSLTQDGEGTLEVFDIQGRLVRRLAEGFFAQGENHIPWDGADDQARAVVSGTYFYRLTVGSEVVTKRMQVVK